MASYGNTHSEPAKMEQIITELFAKSLHIILESRCPYVSSRNYSGDQMISSPSSSSSSSSSVRPRDKWFNLALRDCPAALENIDFWRQSNLEPMVVDVILVQRPTDWGPVNFSPKRGLVGNLSSKERFPYFWTSEFDEFGCEAKREKVIERWVVQYESRKSSRDCSSGSKRSSCTSSNTLYKKSILLLRSLYATVRLLPAYKLFRDLNSSGQIRTFNLAHRVSSFVEPFTRREEAEMQRFVFTPVDTSCGRLCLSVLYRSSLSDVASEPSTPMSPQFIPDYVGSPMADPLKRFPSLPVPQGSPSFSPFGRRHSWSYDLCRASSPSAFPSPSPTYSDSRASISKPSSHRLPPTCLPRHLPETPQVHMKNTSFDEYWPSPTFSPSPSPSPPTYIPGSHMSNALLRSESAPLNIPASRLANSPSLSISNKQSLPPSPPLKGTRPSISKTDRSLGLVQTGSTVEKLFSFGKDDIGKFSGVKISSDSSPQKSFSRSSSRLSFQDDFDDSEFSGPFVVDDDDLTDPGSRLCTSPRPGSFDQKGHQCESHEPGGLFPVRKSQDAAVGALVRMLKKAPPLRQDLSQPETSQPETLSNCTQEPNKISEETGIQRVASSSITSSRIVMSKTTADALEELKGYREMKDLLLRQGGRS
uniref:Putative autophagy-related protein 13 isoform X1 n=1 Tax=Davidia involucrata TaxID=16924 RepID=A0A5B6ZS33_DAVIN